MDSNLINTLGLVAGFCTTISIVPQMVKVHRTRQTRDISLGMFGLLAFGVALWTIYGFLINKPPIIIANSVSFVLILYVLIMKLRHG